MSQHLLNVTKLIRKHTQKKNCEISDICQNSVTLPTLYPDMDRKKFRHIFYTFTYLPIKKIWTNLEKSWYFYKAYRLLENRGGVQAKCKICQIFADPFIASVTTSSTHSHGIVDF